MSCEQFYSILPSIILGSAGILVTIIFAVSTKRREHHKIMYELYREFNERYDKLNNELIRIMEPNPIHSSTLQPSKEYDHGVLIDYINLCAEEYFWYRKKRIDKKVWQSWNVGMNYWYNHPSGVLKELWKEEMKKKNGPESYYISKGDEFFKDNG